MNGSKVDPATDLDISGWSQDCWLGFVRPSRGPDYVRDVTVVHKVASLISRVTEERSRVRRLERAVKALLESRGTLPCGASATVLKDEHGYFSVSTQWDSVEKVDRVEVNEK